jgi:glycosyltransferase involved in cell wall biosynthesis
MKLGIGTPTINRKDLLTESLATLLPQCDDYEHLVIVDNGRQNIKVDNDKVTVINNGTNKGVAGSWNQIINILVDKYDVDYVLMLNDDIVLGEKQIKVIKEQIEKHSDKLFLVGDLGWSVWCMDVSMLPAMEYEPKKYFDEKFFPAYFEDNDFHYRMKLAGVDKSIALHELGPKVRRTSMTLNKDKNVTKGSNNGAYYSKKWGGSPGHEKFKTPFNAATSVITTKIKNIKEAFVLYGKSMSIFKTLESINELYDNPQIIIFSGNESGMLRNLQFTEGTNVSIHHIQEPIYLTNSIWKSLDLINNDVEYLFFLNEYVILKKRLDVMKAYDISSLANFGPGFDSKDQSDWFVEQAKTHCPDLRLDTVFKENKWNGVWASMFGCQRSVIEKIKETGFDKVLPETVDESQAMERGWGILLRGMEMDHVTNSLSGDFFGLLKNKKNEYIEIGVTGNGGE